MRLEADTVIVPLLAEVSNEKFGTVPREALPLTMLAGQELEGHRKDEGIMKDAHAISKLAACVAKLRLMHAPLTLAAAFLELRVLVFSELPIHGLASVHAH
jgi:hypothetical protein